MEIKEILKIICMLLILTTYIGTFIIYSILSIMFCNWLDKKEKEKKMELKKFYHLQTGDIIYVVTGEKNRIEAFKFVSQYKKMNYSKMLLTHKVVKGRINKYNELFTYNIKNVNGTDCWAVARNNIELNSKKF